MEQQRQGTQRPEFQPFASRCGTSFVVNQEIYLDIQASKNLFCISSEYTDIAVMNDIAVAR